MPPIFNLQRLILASAAFAIMVMASSTTWADPITINQWRLGGFAPANNDSVPEPASLFLMGSGLVGAAGVLRRRLKNRNTESQK